MTFAETLGQQIRAARKGYQLTQVQLAELVGISDRTVRDIELGRTGPSFASVLATAEAVGLELSVR